MVLSAILLSSDDVDDHADGSCYLAVHSAAMIMNSMVMLSLNSMADEVVQAEEQRLDVEMVANEDLHKLLYELHALTLE